MTKARDLANGGFGLVLMKPSSVVNGTDNGKGTVTIGSAVSSVSLNDVFNSTYKNYKIKYTTNAFSAAGNFNFRLRVSNSDNSSSNYKFHQVDGQGASPWWDGFTATADTKWTFHRYTRPDGVNGEIEVYQPYETSYTGATARSTTNNYSISQGAEFSGTITVTTSYTGFTLFPETGTMTGGTISVYGYNN